MGLRYFFPPGAIECHALGGVHGRGVGDSPRNDANLSQGHQVQESTASDCLRLPFPECQATLAQLKSCFKALQPIDARSGPRPDECKGVIASCFPSGHQSVDAPSPPPSQSLNAAGCYFNDVPLIAFAPPG